MSRKFSSVTSLKFACLVQTGTIIAKIFNISAEVAIVNMTNVVPGQMLRGQMFRGHMLKNQMLQRQMLHGQMSHGQLSHGQLSLDHLSAVKDGSTNLKWQYLFLG